MAQQPFTEIATLEDYDNFDLLDRSQAKQVLEEWNKSNIRRLRSPYIRKLLDAVERGVDGGSVYMAVCTVSTFAAVLGRGAANLLSPASSFEPVSRLVEWLKKNSYDLGIAGFYDKNENALFVITNHPYVEMNNEMFSVVLMHEMCHYYAHNNAKEFKALFFDLYILPFYQCLFKKLAQRCGSEVDDETLRQMAINYVENLMQAESEKDNDMWNKYFVRALTPVYKTDRILFDYIIYYIKNFQREDVMRVLDEILFECYRETHIPVPHDVSFMYQEILFPSEVVCLASLVHAKKPQFLNMLDDIFRS